MEAFYGEKFWIDYFVNESNWRLISFGRLAFFSFFAVASIVFIFWILKNWRRNLAQKPLKNKLSALITPFVFLVMVGAILSPLAAYKDLKNGLETYVGNCDLELQPNGGRRSPSDWYFVKFEDGGVKQRLRVGHDSFWNLKNKLPGQGDFRSNLKQVYTSACPGITHIRYLPNSKIAFLFD